MTLCLYDRQLTPVAGVVVGAPLRFDFHPDRCAAPGLLLVGDATGMISPFTGEGIGYALESGRLAAETVDDALNRSKDSDLNLSAYPAALGRQFTGYFETGRQSARRYQLIWHVLESTFQNETPLFDICRSVRGRRIDWFGLFWIKRHHLHPVC